MNMYENPALTNTLLKLEYPLPDYRIFSISWPHSCTEIKELHKNLIAPKIDPDAFKNMTAAVRAFGCSASSVAVEFRKFGLEARRQEDLMRAHYPKVKGNAP
jgi:hypothetical protein